MQTDQKLLEPQQALWSYLDNLLQEIPRQPVSEPKPQVREQRPVRERPPVAPLRQEPKRLPAARPAPSERATPAPQPVTVPATMLPVPRKERPEWAQAEFQALVFSVGGLSLAVPLTSLNGVLKWPKEGISPMPNQPDWCYGLLRYRDQNVRVVNTAALVIPPDRPELMPTEPPRHLLVVDGGRWALSCNEIGDVLRLAPEQVKWRRYGGKRPWLAGTVLKHLCALIDTEAFAYMLAAKNG